MFSKTRNRREQGMTVAMLAVFIVGLFGMAALAIDLGILYTARTSAQHAADAAALAGAMTFTNPGVVVQPLAATDAAIATAGTNMVLGQPVVISAAEVNVDIPNRRVTVEPGVTNLEITKQVAPYGYYYAPDPSSQQVCSIGGNVAENSGGAHCLKYGFTTNHVTGLEVVTATGDLVQLGGKAPDPPG
ncbi:MAG: FAD-binding protein, partial [Nevskiales bacterium]